MANELSVHAGLVANLNGANLSASGSASVTVSGDAFVKKVVSVGIVREAVASSSDLSSYGYVFIKNLDTTNYIEVGCYNSDIYYTVKVKAGEVALFRSAGNALYAKANSADVLIEFVLIEN